MLCSSCWTNWDRTAARPRARPLHFSPALERWPVTPLVWGSAGEDGAPIMLGGSRHPFCMIHSSTGAEMNAETLAIGYDHEEHQWSSTSIPEIARERSAPER